MGRLPTGTVTFLFTDIEGSTKLWENCRSQMEIDLIRHDELLREAIESNGGYVFKTVGDEFCAVFWTASEALSAALDGQLALQDEQWRVPGGIKVRMALHAGEANEREEDYFGPTVNRVARLLGAGHGGQILVSSAVNELVKDSLSEGASLCSLGSYQLKDLSRQQLFQLNHERLETVFPELVTLNSRPNNLPRQLTPFVGRAREFRAITDLMEQASTVLVTLTGPGGTGKTRLALQVAAGFIDAYKHGVYFIDLAPIRQPELVVPTIAQTLGLKESEEDVRSTLKRFLESRQILLILDNFEQVVEAATEISELLEVGVQVKILITSREPLRVRGEQEYVVPPLEVPGNCDEQTAESLMQFEGVRLFIDRAVAVKSDFAVTNENAPAVAEICNRLDGLPLAIELAVAHIRLLTPQAILERFKRQLPLLAVGLRDLPTRQQTLQQTIAWSYDLLDESERKLFRCLSVFAGGCTLPAAETMCRDNLIAERFSLDFIGDIASLVDKNLLIRMETVEGDSRLSMLGTIRN